MFIAKTLQNFKVLVPIVALVAGANLAQAEQLTIDSTPATKLQLPVKGSSKHAVKQRYGAPVSMRAAVGKPPISRWIYNDFIVVFEYNHVVHAFARLADIDNLSAEQIAKRPRNAR